MIILPQEVLIKWSTRTKKYYEGKGYILTKYGDSFLVNVEDLHDGCKNYINVKCDYCGEEFQRRYSNYVIQIRKDIIHKDACFKCVHRKIKDSNLIVYGVENTSSLETVREKVKQTNLKKYGTICPIQNIDVSKKTKNTNLDKYGVEHYSQTEEFKQKFKETSLKKYGTKNPSQNEDVKNKTKQTVLEKYNVEYIMQNKSIREKTINIMLEKYGVEHYAQTDECKEKTKQTNLERFGCEYPAQNEKILEKLKQTNLERYGVEYYTQANDFKEKVKQTSLNKYGTEHYNQNLEVISKRIQTLYNNGNCQTSSQQLEIYSQLKDNNYTVELNYPVSRCLLDIALFINNIKIDIEYDGYHWHDPKKDRKRDEFLKSQGWKILRIKSGHKIPSLEQVQEGIFKLVNTDRTFTQIILDDWKEKKIM